MQHRIAMERIIFVPGNITREQRRNTKDFRAVVDETNKRKYDNKGAINIGIPVKIYSLATTEKERQIFDKVIQDVDVATSDAGTPNALLKAIYSTGNIIENA